MDCCGSSKSKEKDEDVTTGHSGYKNSPTDNGQAHGGSCCGGGSSGMWLHLIIMLIVFVAIWFSTKR